MMPSLKRSCTRGKSSVSAWRAVGRPRLAALLSGAYRSSEREVVGVLCCGGNLDIAAMLRAAL